MSRRMARVVSSTRPAKTKVQMGSATAQRGSSCAPQHFKYILFHALQAQPLLCRLALLHSCLVQWQGGGRAHCCG